MLKAQKFELNINCEIAYKNIIALKLNEGKTLLTKEKQSNPTNLIPILFENYIDFLSVYTSGSLTEYENVKKQIDNRVGLLKKGNVNSPYYLYAQREIHIHAAVLHIKFGEYISAIFDIRKALKKLEENQKSFPQNIPNMKSLGHALYHFGQHTAAIPNRFRFNRLIGQY
ncbi:MAG: hypothetical protein LRY27_00050 [Chitinophagales bacterium]|nr:hypothetical protein [Chitinophagales bacterium]